VKRIASPSDHAVSEVAWLYYVKGLKQGEIAVQLGLSRPTVITYLKLARHRRLMDVKLSGAHFSAVALADRLRDEYGLARVLVVPSTGDADADLADVADAAAHHLLDFVEPGDELGVSWGKTLSLVSERVPWWPVENVTVRQLIGSLANPLLPTCEKCTTEIASRLSAQCINLNAPAVCSDADLAHRLKNEPIIATQLSEMRRCNKAIYSLSPCTPDTHVVQFNIATEADVISYRDQGAVGILVGRFFDREAQPIVGALDERLIGADHALISKMAGMLVVSGVAKTEATRAALKGGFIAHLVIDAALAEAVLEAP
jgi:DNA-binding transcriptional regulator LsrR (DeoR family)